MYVSNCCIITLIVNTDSERLKQEEGLKQSISILQEKSKQLEESTRILQLKRKERESESSDDDSEEDEEMRDFLDPERSNDLIQRFNQKAAEAQAAHKKKMDELVTATLDLEKSVKEHKTFVILVVYNIFCSHFAALDVLYNIVETRQCKLCSSKDAAQ